MTAQQMKLLLLLAYCFFYVYSSKLRETQTDFKLSDLPVLKKWEIPNHQFSKHVGRKYKDLENLDRKRSTYWELKPDFTANELDWDEEPAKIKLDFNYKNFFDDDDDAILNQNSRLLRKQKKSLISKHSKSKKPTKSTTFKTKHLNTKVQKTKKHSRATVLRHNITVHSRVTKKDSKGHSHGLRVRRSLYLTQKDLEGEEVDGRTKRDTFGDILKKAQLNALQKLDRIDLKLKKLTTKKSVIPLVKSTKKDSGGTVTNSKRDFVSIKPTKQNEQGKIKTIVKNHIAVPTIVKRTEIQKVTKISGELGDEVENQVKRSHIKSSGADLMKTRDSIIRNDVNNNHSISERNEIEHASKPNMDIVPSNVARAVAMAMEQLKRDRMWGKVFVHVRPSGQLKVMVQETKKMEQ